MNNTFFLDATKIKTLEQYASAMLMSLISIKSLVEYHIAADAGGLLEEDEQELNLNICFHLKKIQTLYIKQIENIQERCPIDENIVKEQLKSLSADLKKPRKKRE